MSQLFIGHYKLINLLEMVFLKHAHRYKFELNDKNSHSHRLMGFTEYSIGIGFFHMHYYTGVCSYSGHTHTYTGYTSLPIKTKNGHYHKMQGLLEFKNNHGHCYLNYTQENVEYTGKQEPVKCAIGSR